MGKKRKAFVKKLKQAVESEFMYRARYGRTHYSMEEVIYVVNKVIDDTVWEEEND